MWYFFFHVNKIKALPQRFVVHSISTVFCEKHYLLRHVGDDHIHLSNLFFKKCLCCVESKAEKAKGKRRHVSLYTLFIFSDPHTTHVGRRWQASITFCPHLPWRSSWWFPPSWPGDVPLGACGPPWSWYGGPRLGRCKKNNWKEPFNLRSAGENDVKVRRHTYAKSFLRALSAFSLWMCSMRMRLFLNTLPLALRYKLWYLEGGKKVMDLRMWGLCPSHTIYT